MVRIAAAVLALISGGAVVAVYLIAWALIPEEPAPAAAPGAQEAAAPAGEPLASSGPDGAEKAGRDSEDDG